MSRAVARLAGSNAVATGPTRVDGPGRQPVRQSLVSEADHPARPLCKRLREGGLPREARRCARTWSGRRRTAVNTHTQAAAAIRAAAARIDSLSAELAEARAALTTAEAALATARPAALTPDAYTMEQVAELLGLSRSTVAELIRRGEIRSVK